MRHTAVAFVFLFASATVWAEFSLNYGLANRHTQRGVKQSGQDVVLQGGLDITGPLGLYAGAWAYTGNFENNNYFEINNYAGVGFNLGPVAMGAGFIRYEFDGNRDPYTEYTANLGFSDYRISGYWDEDETYRYFEASAIYQFWKKSGMIFTVGRTDDFVHNETWNYSVGYSAAMPSDVDLSVKLTRHDEKGNGIVVGITKEINF